MPTPRENLPVRADARGLSLASLSRMIGRNDAYLQQFVQRGSPKRLDDGDRRSLAMCLDADERLLGARDPWSPSA